jgi:3'-phosphoadenosine 5'-phosphosulfate sulfotransferase (PAPS reductase)/FAD synthetase
MQIKITPAIQQLIDDGALFAINHSGGKDSQAMAIELEKIIPKAQLVYVHADLGRIEYEGTLAHAKAQADAAGIPFLVANAVYKDGKAKTFFNYAEHRKEVNPTAPSFPSANDARWCTSELKRDPINRVLRQYANKHGFKAIVSCQGIRAQESTSRSKKQPWAVEDRLDCAKRAGFVWYPIFEMSVAQVKAVVAEAGQQLHPAYAAGNDRLSCVFCIMASDNDILNGALARPELLAEYIALEEKLGYTMHVSRRSLGQIVADAQAAAELPMAA